MGVGVGVGVMTNSRKVILNFKGYNLNWTVVTAQRPCCSMKESRNQNLQRGIVLHTIIACVLLACYQ